MTAPVVVFAIDNPSRGNDALGPFPCGRLKKWLENEMLSEGFELGEPLTKSAEQHADAAMELLKKLCRDCSTVYWEGHQSAGRLTGA